MAGEIQLNSTTFATESGGTITVSNVDSATNRQNLGLEIGVDVQQFDADTTKNDVANTFTANQIISVTDNTHAALRVTQLGTGNALVVEDSTNPDSTPFVVKSSGNVGIGTDSPNYLCEIKSTGSSVLAISAASTSDDSVINFINGTTVDGGITYDHNASFASEAMKFRTGNDTVNMTLTGAGNLTITGSISKGSGSFKIDHPLPEKKDTHYLVHSFIEGPQADNIYRGKVNLVDGLASVNIDSVAGMTEGTFVLLNREIQCFTSNETGWTAVKGFVSGNILTITAEDQTCTDTISWLVIGERQDQHMMQTDWTDETGKVIVEPTKPLENL